MKSLNLFILTRYTDIIDFSLYEKNLSDRAEVIKKVKKDEIDTICFFVNVLLSNGSDLKDLDNWFYSFSIPQISKEFDLLLIDKNRKVVNIEIKSRNVEEKNIEKQQIQNRYYLANVADEIFSYTFVRIDHQRYELYKYDEALSKSNISEVLNDIRKITNPIENRIEDLFTPKDFLISPINTPDMFLKGNYYLTNQQEEIKRKICKDFPLKKQLYGINGAAGTGKSLLIYDLAKEFSKASPVCVIHSGNLSDGHKILCSKMSGVNIYPAKQITPSLLFEYEYVIVDETQRLYASVLDNIISNYNSKEHAICVFAYDFAQVLSKKEKSRNNPQKLREIEGFQEEKLSVRIRSNKEIFSFVRNMMTLSDFSHSRIQYSNIDITYANNIDEAKDILRYYSSKGYVFITLTPSQYVKNSIDYFSGNINSHEVVGQEFDKVAVVLDNNFKYSEDGILQAKEHPNPDYLFANLFYQNITRAKEKLAIVVLNNKPMFEKMITIFADRDN